MRKLVVLLALAACTSLPVPDADVAIRAGALVDVEAGVVRRNPLVLVKGDRIVSVSYGTAAPRGVKLIDLGDAVLLPGLIDAHVHLAWQGSTTINDDAKTTLQAGFTTVRNLGSTGRTDLALRDAIARGEVEGPRMLAAGPGIGAPGGACDRVFGGEAVAKDTAEFAQRAEEVIAAGADVVKVCAGGDVIPRDPGERADVTAEQLRAIVEVAARHGKKVAVHAQSEPAIRAAVEAGVASIEHGGYITPELAQQMRAKHIYLVPTLARLDFVVENAEKNKAPNAATLAKRRDTLGARFTDAVKAGVEVALGTDATVLPHGQNARELATLVRLGMSPMDALRAATVNAADLLGRTDVGSIATGKRADLIAVATNPIADITTVQNVRFVMKDGRVVKR